MTTKMRHNYRKLGVSPNAGFAREPYDSSGVMGREFSPLSFQPLSWYDVNAGAVNGYYMNANNIHLPGIAGVYVSTPDSATLHITGDLDLRADVLLADWTPTGTPTVLIGKWGGGSQRAFHFRIGNGSGNGNLQLNWTADGNAPGILVGSSVAPTIADGARLQVRVTLDVDNGAAGNDVKFYTRDPALGLNLTNNTSWVQLGTTQTTPGVTSVFPGTDVLYLNGFTAASWEREMNYYQAVVMNGINGTVVAEFNASNSTFQATGVYTDTVGTNAGVWTANRPASSGALWFRDLTKSNVRYTDAANLGSTGVADTNDPLYLAWTGQDYLYLPGNAIVKDYVSTPSTATLNILGDISIAVKIAPDTFPSAYNSTIIGKTDGGAVRSYEFAIIGNNLRLLWQDAIGNIELVSSPIALPAIMSAGDTKWLAVTLDVDNGAAGKDIRFWYGDDGVTWTQLGTTITAGGVTNIVTSTNVVAVGASVPGGYNQDGKIFQAQIRNGIGPGGAVLGGTLVADFNAGKFLSGSSTTYTDNVGTNGGVWTITRNTAGRKAALVKGKSILLFGTDDYMMLSAGSKPGFGPTNDSTVLLVVRQWATPASDGELYANDGSGARVELYNPGTSTTVRGFVSDGTVATGTGAPPYTLGLLNVVGFVIASAGQNIAIISNTKLAPPTDLSAITGSRAGTLNGVVGSYISGGFSDIELMGVATFNKAITDAELAAFVNYYNAGV